MEVLGKARPALIPHWQATEASLSPPRLMRFEVSSMAATHRSPQAIRVLTACPHLRKPCMTKRSRWFYHISVTHGVIVAAWLPQFRLTGAGKACNEMPGVKDKHQRRLDEGIDHSRPASLALVGSIPPPAKLLHHYWQTRGFIKRCLNPSSTFQVESLKSDCNNSLKRGFSIPYPCA